MEFKSYTSGTVLQILYRLVGPQGHAELAISKVKLDGYHTAYGGCETPASEPATDLIDQLWDSEDECGEGEQQQQQQPIFNAIIQNGQQAVGMKKTHQRRLSDPSSMLNDFMRLGVMDRPGGGGGQQQQRCKLAETNDHFDALGDACCEIYAGDLLDEFEETKYNPLWTMRGHTQIFHFWRESKRMQCVPLGQFVTFVALPWWSILKDILDRKSTPLLTF